jgi:hypothetical protein
VGTWDLVIQFVGLEIGNACVVASEMIVFPTNKLFDPDIRPTGFLFFCHMPWQFKFKSIPMPP